MPKTNGGYRLEPVKSCPCNGKFQPYPKPPSSSDLAGPRVPLRRSETTRSTASSIRTTLFPIVTPMRPEQIDVAYQWQHFTNAIPGATGSSLTLTNANLGNAGSYSVVLTNLSGSAVSVDAMLVVSP